MDILFASAELERICTDPRRAIKKLGSPSAKKLRRRLADLMAAATVAELVAGRPHPLTGDRAGQLAMNLHGGHRLVIESAHPDSEPRSWPAVSRVRIVFIGDYHD